MNLPAYSARSRRPSAMRKKSARYSRPAPPDWSITARSVPDEILRVQEQKPQLRMRATRSARRAWRIADGSIRQPAAGYRKDDEARETRNRNQRPAPHRPDRTDVTSSTLRTRLTTPVDDVHVARYRTLAGALEQRGPAGVADANATATASICMTGTASIIFWPDPREDERPREHDHASPRSAPPRQRQACPFHGRLSAVARSGWSHRIRR